MAVELQKVERKTKMMRLYTEDAEVALEEWAEDQKVD